MVEKLQCPYCNNIDDYSDTEIAGQNRFAPDTHKCSKCEKIYTYKTVMVPRYDTSKAPCLNGGDHIWKLQKSTPNFYSKMICSSCGKSRLPLLSERLKYGIPSYSSRKSHLLSEIQRIESETECIHGMVSCTSNNQTVEYLKMELKILEEDKIKNLKG